MSRHEPEPPELNAAQRQVVGRSWLWRMQQEQLAVSAFSQLTTALAQTGCQPVVLELVARAAADEVRHAQVCGRLARRWLGDAAVPAFFHGAGRLPAWDGVTEAQALALQLAEICCVSETLTGAFFTEMLERTRDPDTRDAVRALLADELDHGRVGWAYLHELAQRGVDLAFVGERLAAILDRQVGDVIAPGDAGPDDPALEAYGYIGPHAAAAIYRAGLADIVIPGFEALGIPS